MKLKLRPVKKEDLEKILEWRNDQEVRKNMLSTKEITWEEHKRYWDNFLKDENKFGYIIEKDGQDAGVIKLEIRNQTAEVNILVAPEFQGRGIGKTALKLIEEKAKEFNILILESKIKQENTASIRIFEENSFKLEYLYFEKSLKEE